ncbi:MAG: EAL domain-containing protein [Leptospirales bacterium]
MARDSVAKGPISEEFRTTGIWVLGSIVAVTTLYLFLSFENIRVNRKIAQTIRFSDSLASLEKVDNLCILNALAPSDSRRLPPIAYRIGLFVQGKAVLSAMKENDSFLTRKELKRLTETEVLFGQLQKDLVDIHSTAGLGHLDRRLLLLYTELAEWSSNAQQILLRQSLLLGVARSIVLLSAFAGGVLFLFRRMRIFRKTSRLNHFYQALSRIDRLILTLPEMETLLSETCRIVVEEGGVIVASFTPTSTSSGASHIRTIFGKATKEFVEFPLSSDPSTPEGRGLWGETVRAGAPVAWNEIQERAEEGAIRDFYKRNNILSGAGFPVFRGGSLFGVFSVYSDEKDFFDPELMKLLEMLIANISFALDNRDREDQRKDREAEVTRLSLFDPLTNLPNRRLFYDRIHQAIERHLRTKERFGVGMLDLDGFKQVNDRLGHAFGDALLVLVASRLKGVLRGLDTLARLGGDEFGIIFSGLEAEKGPVLFERVIGSLALPFEIGEECVTIGGSIGITFVPPDEGDNETLVKHADIAMYQVKEHGKNGWKFFSPSMTEALENTHRIKMQLPESFQENRFALHYQPQVEMDTGKLMGVEAQLRWNHPERGLLDSKHFIGILEGCELVLDVERWALEQILCQIEDWSKNGIAPKVRMNIGARHLLSGTFIGDLEQAFSRHPGVLPESLELNITETKLFREIREVKAVFDACRSFGVSVSIGNIGTELGSLSYMQSLGVDRLTIDQAFVRNLSKSPQDMAIVASLITSAQLMLIDVIGEGIETEEEGLLLLQWGCRIGQGSAIAPPMLPEMLPDWSRQYRPFDSWSQWENHPWEPKDYQWLMAREDARVFYENFLEGIGTPGKTRVEWTDSHRCLQGRWIDGDGGKRYGHIPDFRQYREMHEHLHSLVREALQARDTGDTDRLSALKRSIKEANRELIEKIETFRTMDP